jgi:hypothetical protein
VLSTSLHLRARIGGEIFFQQSRLSITPAGRVDFVRWSDEDDTLTAIHWLFSGEVRTAVHVGRLAPYLTLGLGFELNGFTGDAADEVEPSYGLGLNLELGVDVIATTNMAIGPALVIHPGFNRFASEDGAPDTTYLGLGLNVAYLQ